MNIELLVYKNILLLNDRNIGMIDDRALMEIPLLTAIILNERTRQRYTQDTFTRAQLLNRHFDGELKRCRPIVLVAVNMLASPARYDLLKNKTYVALCMTFDQKELQIKTKHPKYRKERRSCDQQQVWSMSMRVSGSSSSSSISIKTLCQELDWYGYRWRLELSTWERCRTLVRCSYSHNSTYSGYRWSISSNPHQ